MDISTFEFTRDPNGNITKSLREDGSCWYYAYDGLQRLTGAHWKTGAGASIYAYEYGYDKVGNRLHIVENGTPTYYQYNAANELVHEVTPGGEIAYYTFDGRGNQTQRKVLGGDTTYFAYNSRNLLTRIDSTKPGFTPNTFKYNALGQRIEKVDSTGTTRYVWDGLNVLLELDASGNVKRRYTYGYSPIPGVSGLLMVQDDLGCPCFYHFDPPGGVRNLTDRWENVIKSVAYEPFGRILARTGSGPTDFFFPANTLMLPDINLVRLGVLRGFLPLCATWASGDLVRGPSRYRFVLGNPLSWVDPDASDPQRFDPRTGEPINPATGQPYGLGARWNSPPNPHYDPNDPAVQHAPHPWVPRPPRHQRFIVYSVGDAYTPYWRFFSAFWPGTSIPASSSSVHEALRAFLWVPTRGAPSRGTLLPPSA